MRIKTYKKENKLPKWIPFGSEVKTVKRGHKRRLVKHENIKYKIRH